MPFLNRYASILENVEKSLADVIEWKELKIAFKAASLFMKVATEKISQLPSEFNSWASRSSINVFYLSRISQQFPTHVLPETGSDLTLKDVLKDSNYTLSFLVNAFDLAPEIVSTLMNSQVDLTQVRNSFDCLPSPVHSTWYFVHPGDLSSQFFQRNCWFVQGKTAFIRSFWGAGEEPWPDLSHELLSNFWGA